MAKLNVEVFADGADIEQMKAAYKKRAETDSLLILA